MIGSQERTVVRECHGAKIRGVLGGVRDLEPRGSPFSGYHLLILLHLLQYGMPILKGIGFKGDVVAQTYDFESLSLLTFAWSLLSQQVLFFPRELSPRTRAASYSRRVFD